MGDVDSLPSGYANIPEASYKGEKIPQFGFKKTPVTNKEWGRDVQKMLGKDRFILLRHDRNTGEIKLEKKGRSINAILGDEISEFEKNAEDVGAAITGKPKTLAIEYRFDRGVVMISGAMILLKMVDNTSAVYDEKGRMFSGANQPAVGITYFHAKAWCILKTLESDGKYKYDLPTDIQYEAVASNFGKCTYGTEACTSLYRKDGRKLAHINEHQNARGATVAVNDLRYKQNFPFGVQTTGNVWRWTHFNSKFYQPNVFNSLSPYGRRGGSWDFYPVHGRADFRYGYAFESWSGDNIGFSPVVVPQGSLEMM